ncbi:hypothetical protein ACVWY1_003377 [Pseudomonas sp. TE6288]|uniref:hypothetical protein n=1 Tax=Pseudomonas hunanensis TaxID=1247546 RepID=UPI002406CFC0|nr:hypothetical protein [Pseudomonas hunanensis]MDF9755639.1 hypothetical protein [Pseudomonas hunanensis]
MRIYVMALLLAGMMALVAPSVQAEGELMVMPASLKLDNTRDRTVSVKNLGDAPLYLSVSVQQVANPGMEPEVKVPLSQVEHPGLLASPDKITLGPGQSRTISLKSLHKPEAEHLYRLYIVPVRAMQVHQAPEGTIEAPMSVAVGYGVLVRHLPPLEIQTTGWTHRCQARGLMLENTGSLRVILSKVTGDNGLLKERLALFPGTPHIFNSKHVSLMAGDQKHELECP